MKANAKCCRQAKLRLWYYIACPGTGGHREEASGAGCTMKPRMAYTARCTCVHTIMRRVYGCRVCTGNKSGSRNLNSPSPLARLRPVQCCRPDQKLSHKTTSSTGQRGSAR